MVRNIVSAVAISLVLLPLSHTPAHAAAGAMPGIRPGLWKMTIKVDDDPPETSTECVSKDEWKTFQARLTKDGPGCKTNEKTSPGRLSAEVNCESGGTKSHLSIVINVRDAVTMEGSTRVSMSAPGMGESRSGAQFSSKRVCDCR